MTTPANKDAEEAISLAEDPFLDDDFLRQLMSVGEVDLLVGIPTYNNALTISQTVRATEESLQQSFIRERVVIVNVDGGSRDETAQAFFRKDERRDTPHRGLTSLRTVHRVSTQYAKSPSPGLALRTIVAAADLLRAKACAMLSPAIPNLNPSWVANLLRPVYREHFDFVAPVYSRGKYQGLLARDLLYPSSRAIFGQDIRELYTDQCGFSGGLASHCLEQEVWHEEAVRTRPEAWMGISAVCSGYQCCQSFLGQKKAAAVPGTDTVETVRETVGNLFWCMESYQAHWLDRAGAKPVRTFGADHELLPGDPPASSGKILELFQHGVAELESILASILTADTHSKIKAIATLEAGEFCFPNDVWVTTVYEFASAYHHTVLSRDHLVQALVPLYRGRLYSFLLKNADASAQQMEADCQMLCQEFERQKPYLVERWKVKS